MGDILESWVVFQQYNLILRAYTRVLPKIGPIPSGHTYHTFYVDHNEASDDASVWSGLVTPGFNLFDRLPRTVSCSTRPLRPPYTRMQLSAKLSGVYDHRQVLSHGMPGALEASALNCND